MPRPNHTRRNILRWAGTSLTTGLAGCTTPPDDPTPTPDVVEADRIHYNELGLSADEWLTESSVGAPAPNYGGTFADERWRESVRLAVGVGDGGRLFDPVAVVVSPGTTVVWEWMGDGGAHNVVADPDAQMGESAYTFDSGEPVGESGHTHEETFEEPGNALYHCERRLDAGMKGVVAVW